MTVIANLNNIAVGTRAKTIKKALVVGVFHEMAMITISTAQHLPMLGQVFSFSGMTSDVNLNAMKPDMGLGDLGSQYSSVLTDSCGDQAEYPSFQKIFLVACNETERPEMLQTGLSRINGSIRNHIIAKVSKFLADSVFYFGMISSSNPDGEGKATV